MITPCMPRNNGQAFVASHARPQTADRLRQVWDQNPREPGHHLLDFARFFPNHLGECLAGTSLTGGNKGETPRRFALSKNNLGAVTTVSLLLTLSVNALAQRLPPEVVVSNTRMYEVTLTTKFVVPENGKTLMASGVWHALPNARPWDGLNRTLGDSAITYKPDSGRVKHLSTNDSQNVFWELRGPDRWQERSNS